MATAYAQLSRIPHSQAIPLSSIPLVGFDAFRSSILDDVAQGGRISALFGCPGDAQTVRLYAVVVHAPNSTMSLAACNVQDRYPSLTPDCPQAHWFEREIAEQWGVVPVGHPWLKPIRFHPSYRPGHDAWSRTVGTPILPSVTDFFRMEGQDIHEVAVGPVHAGVIEPGHFRFQCHGEHVFHLEISLGFQHRGVERALVGGPNKRTIHYMETLAGDTSVGHATAYCQAIEMLSHCQSPLRGQVLRGVGLELERLANHTGDMGALALDVGFLPTSAYCGRLRGDFLNATAAICGNRFGRGLVRPGGVAWDVDKPRVDQGCFPRLKLALRDVDGAGQLLWRSSRSGSSAVRRHGARAAGDCRGARPGRSRGPGIGTRSRRAARFSQRHLSFCADSAIELAERRRVCEGLCSLAGDSTLGAIHSGTARRLPAGPVRAAAGPLAPDSLAVSLVEGWRGEICHVAITNSSGSFAHYKVVDPSFHNWVGLMMALRDQPISDFPLCNKSFNLSYCGHDL